MLFFVDVQQGSRPNQDPTQDLSIKMGIFDKSNYIVNTGIIEQVFECTAKVDLVVILVT